MLGLSLCVLAPTIDCRKISTLDIETGREETLNEGLIDSGRFDVSGPLLLAMDMLEIGLWSFMPTLSPTYGAY